MKAKQYLARQLEADLKKVAHYRALIDIGLDSLLSAKEPKTCQWPIYMADCGKPKQPSSSSITNSAMILHAIGVSTGSIKTSVLAPGIKAGQPTGDLRDSARSALEEGTTDLIRRLTQAMATGLEIHSSTWGENDPLTLTWLHELMGAEQLPNVQAGVVDHELKNLAINTIKEGFGEPRRFSVGITKSAGMGHPANPFRLLRLVQLAKSIDCLEGSNAPSTTELVIFLEGILHKELSISAKRDPSVLVFALEALMLINRESVGDELVDRVVDVLRSDRSRSAHWRPARPVHVTEKGSILLPQSVEVAGSYLRIVSLREEGRAEPLFARSRDLLDSFAGWTSDRTIKVRGASGSLIQGWQSEHIYTEGRIDPWATSQVLLFLQYYCSILEEHIAWASREDGGLEFKQRKETTLKTARRRWDAKCSYEPMQGQPGSSKYRTYQQVTERFVDPRNAPEGCQMGTSSGTVRDPNFSMLLYGPPGTGKTTFAQSLADAVGFDFINVTPSDFTRTGESGVEERAQQLFKALMVQSDAVILFDEIDRLLLDRESDRYGTQSDMFQFMTPSMLTKLADLRDKKRCIFIIATNYAARIDAAIKRPGRIDVQLLLLPPDSTKRKEIINSCLVDLKVRYPAVNWGTEVVEAVADATPLYVFKELQHVVGRMVEKKARAVKTADIEDTLKEVLDEFPANITLGQYKRTLYGKRGRRIRECLEKGPWEEFGLLTYLFLEKRKANEPPAPEWVKEVIGQVYKRFEEDVSKVLERACVLGTGSPSREW